MLTVNKNLEFNLAKTRQRFGNDDMLLVEVLRTSVEELPPMAERLEEVRAGGDLAQMAQTAHWVKGALSLMSAQPSVAIAQQIEQAAEAGNREEADKLIRELHRRTLLIVEQAEEVLAQLEAA